MSGGTLSPFYDLDDAADKDQDGFEPDEIVTLPLDVPPHQSRIGYWVMAVRPAADKPDTTNRSTQQIRFVLHAYDVRRKRLATFDRVLEIGVGHRLVAARTQSG